MTCFSFSSSLPILVFSLLFLLSEIPVSRSSPELYKNCRDAVFECGNIYIGYPFFGGLRQPECGHPGLGLYCDNNTNKTTIEVDGVKYKVMDILPEGRTLRIVREEEVFKDDFCRPQIPIRNSIINSEVLNPATENTKVTLFYDCPTPTLLPSFLGTFPCNSDYRNVSVTTDDIRGEGCSANVTFSIPRGRFQFHNDPYLFWRSLSEALKAGFEVKWKEDTQACRNCTTSGGACGFDWFINQTVCFCPFFISPEYPNQCQGTQLPPLHLTKFSYNYYD
ncbi:Leaf rust 10 disease-resistance locus receptor-like protein kinase-like 3 [Hibiscus trionum]|uniref:non-specific serine/threonine protein kinase n=1 Tax=Hibiscus trionum TaxID=183268 RepID=A0A9W7HG16_HIBTR|nr:Leaf rust 10 disease-resistance locus receptor-like protein kinase-like 3 [Hibiscus trionum]